MQAKVVVKNPFTSKTTVVVAELPLTIGRSRDATVRLSDSFVSRKHCRIEQQGEQLVVHDLGSKYGTQVNRHPVTDAKLEPGDELMVGFTCLWASLDGGAGTTQITAS